MSIKKLASQTAIYGLSSIVGRALNYLLVPFYTRVFSDSEYGVVSHLYAWAGVLLILLVYRMETSYFRFESKDDSEKANYFGVSFTSIVISTLGFLSIIYIFRDNISSVLGYPSNVEYILMFAGILAFDVLSEIPYAKLRLENKAIKFATIRIAAIVMNLAMNYFFLILCPKWTDNSFISSIYDADFRIGYIFLANLISSGLAFLLLMLTAKGISFKLDKKVWNQMVKYSFPLVIVGLAGIVNELADRILLEKLLPGTKKENLGQLGIYSANYKIAMLIALFTQAFRYAAEPFFFKKNNDADAKKTFSNVTHIFSIISMVGFVTITLFLNQFGLLLGEDFRVGLRVVPILLMANVFLGLYYNISVWYKLTDKTSYGAVIAIIGAVITLAGNFIFIPLYGYMACAWITVLVYFIMTVLCYFLGQKHFPVNYPLGRILMHLIWGVSIYLIYSALNTENILISIALWVCYIASIYTAEAKRFKTMIG